MPWGGRISSKLLKTSSGVYFGETRGRVNIEKRSGVMTKRVCKEYRRKGTKPSTHYLLNKQNVSSKGPQSGPHAYTDENGSDYAHMFRMT